MKLKRAHDRYLGGVCGSIAEKLKIAPSIIRIMWVVLTVLTCILPGVIVYLIYWATMLPSKEQNK